MRWFLLCLARHSAAQKALEACEPNYTRNIYVYFEYRYTAYVALPPEAKTFCQLKIKQVFRNGSDRKLEIFEDWKYLSFH